MTMPPGAETWAEALADLAEDVTAATQAEGVQLQQDLRLQTLGAGLGQRLANAWRLRRFPTTGVSLHPAAVVKTNAGKIVDAFDRGVTIRSRTTGRWLAIPTPAAGPKRTTPQAWEQAAGLKLRFVPLRGGRSALLVADGARLTKGGFVRELKDRSRSKDPGRLRGQASVVVFTLVRSIRLPKRLDIDLVASAAASRLADRIGANSSSLQISRAGSRMSLRLGEEG